MNETQGYQILTDKKGKQIAVETATGEVFDTFNAVLPVGSLIYTPEQQEDYKARKKKEQDEYLRSKRYGEKKPSYTFVMTTADFKNVSPANLTRLIYLSTYLSYHNSELRKGERHKITKNELPQILGISERTAQRFWREVCPQYISEDIDETLKLNPDVFSRGRAKRLMAFYIKVFSKGMESLYNSVPKSKHKHLGYIFAMLPYVNVEHNILCYDTAEKNIDKIEPMNMKDFCSEIGFDYRHVDRLHDIFKSIMFDVDGNKELFCSIIRNTYSGKELMVINPKVFYSGKNETAVAEFGVFY